MHHSNNKLPQKDIEKLIDDIREFTGKTEDEWKKFVTKKLSIKYHPDKNKNGEEIFKLLDTLSYLKIKKILDGPTFFERIFLGDPKTDIIPTRLYITAS